MMDIPYYKQETMYDCGPTCLQMILSYFGKETAQQVLAERLGTGPDVWLPNERLAHFLHDEGFHTYTKTSATLEDLKAFLEKKIPVIINYIEPEDGDGHFAIPLRIDETHITLRDPWHGERFTVSREYFLDNWRSYDGNHTEWLLAVSYTPFET